MAEAVRLVIWDLDDTFWRGTLTEGGIKEYVRSHHDIVIELAQRGIMSSVCSKNDPSAVLPILREAGMLDYFIFPSISWEAKGPRLAQLIDTVGLRPPTVMFVDDNPNIRGEAAAMVPGLQVESEQFIAQMLSDPRLQGKDDKALTRLAQYKLLEQRKRDEQQVSGSNEDFLRSCDIRVLLDYDVESHIDRAIELINRTNQLNYTKRRLPEDREEARALLRAVLRRYDRAAALVRVIDKYGDYGYVGLFLLHTGPREHDGAAVINRLEHFCFSCRTLGMLIEHWVYDHLGRPILDVVGDVLTDLSVPRQIDWVRQVAVLDEPAGSRVPFAPKVVLWGGCEVSSLAVYLYANAGKVETFGPYTANGVAVGANFAARLLDCWQDDPAPYRDEIARLGLPDELEWPQLAAAECEAGTLYVFSLAADAHGRDRLRHRQQDWTFCLAPEGLAWNLILDTSADQLEDEMVRAGHLTPEQRCHVHRVAEHVRETYEFERSPNLANVMLDTRLLLELVPRGAKVIIVTRHDEQPSHDDATIISSLKQVAAYKQQVAALVEAYPYAATVSFSDAINGPQDVLEVDHYVREVYLRIVEQIVATAQTLQPRQDAPVSKRRMTRMLSGLRTEERVRQEARTVVEATFNVLLRRPVEAGWIEQEALKISSGEWRSGDFIHAVSRGEEFASKWAPKVPDDFADRSKLLDLAPSRLPDALTLALQERVRQDARTVVEATFEVLLRRGVDADWIEQEALKITSGQWHSGDFIRAVSRSEEFAAKWTPRDPGEAADRSKLLDFPALRVPDELTLTPLAPKRVLIVGSCLSESLRSRIDILPNRCHPEFYFVGSELPQLPAHSLGDYDFQIVQLALRFIFPDSAFARLGQLDHGGHERLFEHTVKGMRQHLAWAMRWNREHGLLSFVFPFIQPVQNPIGRLMPRYDLRNPVYFIERLNEALERELTNYSNAFLFDLNEVLAHHGRRFSHEDAFTSINHGSFIGNCDAAHDGNRLEPAGQATDYFDNRLDEVFSAVWRELVGQYRTVRQIDPVKLVVVDLDDTMWRGVMAEADPANLPTSEGWPLGLWEALLMLKRRGIMLAILSKNEESRVEQLWPEVFGRFLAPGDFVIRKINWAPKSQNMTEILDYVNLLPRNVLYIDDNPVERAAVQGAFPGLRVLGGSPLLWRRILLWSPETQVAHITAESASRTDMVRAQVQREDERRSLSHEDFLASLEVSVKFYAIDGADHPRFPRVLELVNKTNQFNTTGRRWSREEFVCWFDQGGSVFAFEVQDRYTHYGLVGVLIVLDSTIAQFVMSCRVLGLGVEQAVLSLATDAMVEHGAASITGLMVETERNLPCRKLYAHCGFEPITGGWYRPIEPRLPMPDHVRSNSQRRATAMVSAAQ